VADSDEVVAKSGRAGGHRNASMDNAIRSFGALDTTSRTSWTSTPPQRPPYMDCVDRRVRPAHWKRGLARPVAPGGASRPTRLHASLHTVGAPAPPTEARMRKPPANPHDLSRHDLDDILCTIDEEV